MRYAVQVATDTEETTYYPEEIDRMKKLLDVEISKSKSEELQIKKGRGRKKDQFRQESKIS